VIREGNHFLHSILPLVEKHIPYFPSSKETTDL
jgi:hypothetical protein